MNLALISAAIAAAIGFGTAWKLQEGQIEHEQNNRLTQQAAAQQALHDLEQARSTQVIVAQNAARERERQLRMDAVANGAAITGLRDALHAAVRTAQTDPDACAERAHALSVISAQCSESITRLAERCDRHVSDLQTLTDAWPK